MADKVITTGLLVVLLGLADLGGRVEAQASYCAISPAHTMCQYSVSTISQVFFINYCSK